MDAILTCIWGFRLYPTSPWSLSQWWICWIDLFLVCDLIFSSIKACLIHLCRQNTRQRTARATASNDKLNKVVRNISAQILTLWMEISFQLHFFFCRIGQYIIRPSYLVTWCQSCSYLCASSILFFFTNSKVCVLSTVAQMLHHVLVCKHDCMLTEKWLKPALSSSGFSTGGKSPLHHP